MKRFYIKTLGCKVNQYESQVIRENFLKDGYTEAEDSDDADICVVNTCTVTKVSDSKSLKSIRSGIGKKNKIIVATGCMVDAKDMELRKLKGADFIVRNRDKYNIPYIIGAQTGNREAQCSIRGFKGHARAFVKVQDGCDNRCSYCKVSIVRGRSRSRPLEDIIEECSNLVKNGYQEIVLTGICLGSFGRDFSNGMDLSKLIEDLCKISGHWRVRLSSIEPKDVTDRLIQQIKSEERLCKHLHIPFQSGDDEILKRMKRPYTVAGYKAIIAGIRKEVPDIAISTDIMVGFPGEKERNFQNTVNFIKEIAPMRMHVFGFSKRIGTPAYNYIDNVSNSVKKEREKELISLAVGFSRAFESQFIGKTAKVLVEHRRDKQGFLQGYTDRYIKVLIDGPDTIKSALITCQLMTRAPFQIYGEPLKLCT